MHSPDFIPLEHRDKGRWNLLATPEPQLHPPGESLCVFTQRVLPMLLHAVHRVRSMEYLEMLEPFDLEASRCCDQPPVTPQEKIHPGFCTDDIIARLHGREIEFYSTLPRRETQPARSDCQTGIRLPANYSGRSIIQPDIEYSLFGS